MEIKRYTKNEIDDVINFELDLRKEETFWGWTINSEYKENVKNSFDDIRFENSVSLLAYIDGKVVGRIDSSLICSHFDGTIKAYLDWICVLKSYRHRKIAQELLAELRKILKNEYKVDTLIALMARNYEAQKFYRSIENADVHDEGIWIEC
ncbi:MAG: GNAT family N-acetyltransferase [Ruminococcaceae bacterium]|nr:GNAT family N-acetyltransferase [Oscillospiraceae bacterium]